MKNILEALLPAKEAPLQTPIQNYEAPWLFSHFHPVIDIMNEKDVRPGETIQVTLKSVFNQEEIASQIIYRRESEESFKIVK